MKSQLDSNAKPFWRLSARTTCAAMPSAGTFSAACPIQWKLRQCFVGYDEQRISSWKCSTCVCHLHLVREKLILTSDELVAEKLYVMLTSSSSTYSIIYRFCFDLDDHSKSPSLAYNKALTLFFCFVWLSKLFFCVIFFCWNSRYQLLGEWSNFPWMWPVFFYLETSDWMPHSEDSTRDSMPINKTKAHHSEVNWTNENSEWGVWSVRFVVVKNWNLSVYFYRSFIILFFPKNTRQTFTIDQISLFGGLFHFRYRYFLLLFQIFPANPRKTCERYWFKHDNCARARSNEKEEYSNSPNLLFTFGCLQRFRETESRSSSLACTSWQQHGDGDMRKKPIIISSWRKWEKIASVCSLPRVSGGIFKDILWLKLSHSLSPLTLFLLVSFVDDLYFLLVVSLSRANGLVVVFFLARTTLCSIMQSTTTSEACRVVVDTSQCESCWYTTTHSRITFASDRIDEIVKKGERRRGDEP